MDKQHDELRKRLLATFKGEAEEHVALLTSELLKLEKAPESERAGIVETVFRESHSLKGAARAVNLTMTESICQAMEGLFSEMKRGSLKPTPEMVDLLLEAARSLAELTTTEESRPEGKLAAGRVLKMLGVMRGGRAPAGTPGVPTKPVGKSEPAEVRPPSVPAARPAESEGVQEEFVRVSNAKLDSLLWQSEELLGDRLSAGQLFSQIEAACEQMRAWHVHSARLKELTGRLQRAIEAGADGIPLREAGRLIEMFERNRISAETIDQKLREARQEAKRHERSLNTRTRGLMEDARKLVMLPCSWLLDGLKPVVRTLARDLGKETELVTTGTEIQVDRRILAELKDPLIHLIRNSIDHGIEPPDGRERAGKPRTGRITIAVTRRPGNRVEVRMADDGAGIDAQKVRAAAVRAGVSGADDASALSDDAARELIFRSGVSTSQMITDLSGRGLGMTIVREKIEALGGSAVVESKPGQGTACVMQLPVAMATFRGVLVRVGDQFLVLPAARVDRVGRVAKSEILRVENREAVAVDGGTVALSAMQAVLKLPAARQQIREQKHLPFIVVSAGTTRMAFVVDEVVGEQEVLVKKLPVDLEGVRGVSGATVLGSGRVVPVLDATEVLNFAIESSGAGVAVSIARDEEKEKASGRSILVAEDSITSRTLLRNILESAGYSVVTAVDGVDAWTRLRTGTFNLVVSDIDMPRMNGFALTAKIRADRKLTELPVVLVTALDSREDRERGIEAGANAYIVKRSFEQSNLLEAVKRLI